MKLNLSHILVRHEYEAEDIMRLLKEGKTFSTLAQKFSNCPSAKNGGSLGSVSLHQLVSEFAEAAEKLQPGSLSNIVRTQFGYHIIPRNLES